MKRVGTFKEIVNLWPNRGEFARAIKVNYVTAQKMETRDFAHVRHFDAIVAACSMIGHPEINHACLTEFATRRAAEREAEKAEKRRRAA
jgi:hypothetical protein